jgi:TonB family protein
MFGGRRLRASFATIVAWAACNHAAAQTLEAPDAQTRDGAPRPPQEDEQPEDPGPVDVRPSVEMAEAAGWILRPDPEPSGREELAEEALDRYFHEELQQDRLSAVGAHGWYYTMMREMRRSFEPDMGEVEDTRRAPMNPIARVVDELGRYRNGPEPPQDPVGMPPPEVINSHLSAEEQAALQMADWYNLNNAPVTWYEVRVRVIQNPEGVVSAAWVTGSSGYPTLDRQALAAVTEGARRLPPPPPEVVGDRQAIQTDWAFEAGDVATYYGQAGCVDDPVHGGYQCAGPFGRGLVRTRIRLVGVVDAENESFEARRARARQNPPRLRGD